MPLYEYACQSCGRRTETLQRLGDPPLTTCEACGGALKKLLSSPAFQFKGSGWYVTDYAGRGKAPAKESGGGEGAKGETAKSEAAKGEGAKGGDDKSGGGKSGGGEGGGGPAKPTGGSSSPSE
jgi:putative FmdB family regulatory protein